MHVVLYDSDKAIGANGRVDQYPDGIFCCAPEFVDLEILLEPLEKQFYLPSVLIKVGDL